jgi:hypothetical protein
MRTIIFILSIILGMHGIANTQNKKNNKESISSKMGIGFNLSEYQNNFGLGLHITSPYFVYNRIAIRLKGNLMYNEYVKDQKTKWEPYSNLSLGIVGVGGEIKNNMRIYGEGGPVFLFPSNDFSSEEFVFGGYGLFGFEFYMSPSFNYHIEIGGVGTGATADKIKNKPFYSNGLLINTGFRIQF